MASQVLTVEAAKAASIQVIETRKYEHAVHETVVAMQANRRQGNACTKRRGEVAGSNKKLYKQKGTGNARAGERRTPVRVGGGTAHGPKPRDYSKKISKKTKKIAFLKALSERIKSGDVISVPSFAIADGKTRNFVAQVKGLTDARKVLIVAAAFDNATYQAARNHAGALLQTAQNVNTEEILNYHKIIVTPDAMETFARRTA